MAIFQPYGKRVKHIPGQQPDPTVDEGAVSQIESAHADAANPHLRMLYFCGAYDRGGKRIVQV